MPQPCGCLWPIWERLGGSLGIRCTPIPGSGRYFRCSRSRYFNFYRYCYCYCKRRG